MTLRAIPKGEFTIDRELASKRKIPNAVRLNPSDDQSGVPDGFTRFDGRIVPLTPIQKASRESAWTAFVACQLSLASHPGWQREGSGPAPTREQITAIADDYLKDFDKRFGGDHG